MVVFPAPFGPKKASTSPLATENVTIDGRVLAVTLSDMVNVDHANESRGRWWMGLD